MMSWFDGWRTRLAETMGRGRVDAELDEEIAFHLERETQRLIDQGVDPDAAAERARRSFGRPRAVREQAREEYGFGWLEGLVRDLKHAARGLARSPLFAITAIVTFALGIGATTAIFSVLSGVVLRPLPYADPGQIVSIRHTDADGDDLGIPDAGYFYYGEHASSLESIAAWLELSEPVEGAGEPLELGIILATPSIFDVLRLTPIHGRLFTARDAEPGAPDVALLTHGFWVQQFGADPAAVGQPVIPGSDLEVIGILPPEFDFIRPDPSIVFGNGFAEPHLLLPLTMRETNARFGNFMYQGMARLAPGADAEQAQRELAALMPQAAERYPGLHTVQSLREGGTRPVVQPLKDALVGRTAGTLWILLGAVGFVLLIAIANVANLFIARADGRHREIAVRRSLGAGLVALARASLVEGLMLSAMGAVLGVILAAGGTQLLLRLAPSDIPRLDEVGFDAGVLAFAAALAMLAGLVFGAFPVLRYGRQDATEALGEESRGGTAGRERQRTRRVLVAAQVAFALVLLIGAGLLVRTVGNLRAVDPGFDGSNVLTLRISMHGVFDSDVERSRFLLEVTERLEGLPGVELASFSGDLPLDGDEWRDDIAIEGDAPAGPGEGPDELRVFIGPGYLEAIGARLIAGRELERQDFAGYPEFAVVNRALAEERWPGEDPIGKRLMQGGNDPGADVWYTVSGVVEDIREMSLMVPPEPTVYLPTVFKPDDNYSMFVQNMPVVIRTSVDPASMFTAVEREIHRVSPEIPINSIMTLSELEARSFQQVSFAMVLVLIAAGVALFLGGIGIYGVVAYLVSLRTREFGIRVALGATPAHLRRAVLREGAFIAVLGTAAGIGGAIALSRIMGSLLFGVAAVDLATYFLAALGLLLVVLLASVIPARRATSVDPVQAIRVE